VTDSAPPRGSDPNARRGVTRRELLATGVAVPLAVARPMAQGFSLAGAREANLDRIKDAPGFVVPAGDVDVSRIELMREWSGGVCHSRVRNRGRNPIAIKEVVLCDVAVTFPESTPIYGEGFQMLSQSAGTLGQPKDLGSYTDAKHYKLPEAPGTKTFYGLMTIAERRQWALAFTSCRRFSGLFRLRGAGSLHVVVDTEGLTLAPGETWDLEELYAGPAAARRSALDVVAKRLAGNHPPLTTPQPPTGWCSWYCFGPRVTARQVLDNLDAIATNVPGLTYVQIDDGYQPAMGDWLETGAAFGGDVRGVLDRIRTRGFQPAIWVAPFVAEEKSHVFEQHRDWFVRDAAGAPLRSDLVTFGGWRRGPWYVLDGTHPEVQRHFEHVFRTMRSEWGCTYFKLDANFWGAIHGGRFHDPKATRIEAYRRGMEAIRRGAGDSFILGCNHPIWPSLGLIHGSRSSNDIKRSWDRVASTARQNLLRNWQNGRLWWNDPDAVVLTGDLTDDEFQFHATAIYATGGMVLSGDDLTSMPAARLAMLKKLLPPTGVAAVFADERLEGGTVALPDGRISVCLFNWGDETASIAPPVTNRPVRRVTDFWSGEPVDSLAAAGARMRPHSARLLIGR
jgi:alpha-galactosidase